MFVPQVRSAEIATRLLQSRFWQLNVTGCLPDFTPTFIRDE
jgi:hypothetical protein